MTAEDRPHYVYVYRQERFNGKTYAKVGVSINPEKRRFNASGRYSNHSGYQFHSKHLAASREEAFRVEALVKRHFRDQSIHPELFMVQPEKVEALITESLS